VGGEEVEGKGERVALPGDPVQCFYYFLPKDFDPAQTHVLFFAFGIRAYGEARGFGWNTFADEAKCIVAAMNLVTTSSYYSSYSYSWGPNYKRDRPFERSALVYKTLSSKFKLAPRMFIVSSDEGARVMQEFVLSNPSRVCGYALHDADSLVTLRLESPQVPLLLTVPSAHSYATRACVTFVEQVRRMGYKNVYFETVPDSSYQAYGEARPRVLKFFKACTGVKEEKAPAKIAADYARAEELVTKGEYADAIALLTVIVGARNAGKSRDQAANLIATIEAIGEKELKQAELVAGQDKAKAAALYKGIVTKFAGITIADTATERLEKLGAAGPPPEKGDKTPEKGPAESETEQLARKLYESGEKFLAEGDKEKALTSFRAAALHADTRAGRLAEAKVKALTASAKVVEPADPDDKQPPKTDPKTTRQADAMTQDCERWLSMAKNYISNKQFAQARTYLKKILAKYPESDYAQSAKELLIECDGK
jgi:tetratricopeptide (TPR) repeat protein